MNRLSHQPKTLILAISVALGFGVLAVGCSGGNGNNMNGTNPGMTSTSANANANGMQANGGMQAGQGNSAQPASDTWITTKVKTALATMQGVDNSAVHVETNNGVVMLTGTASSQASVNAMKNAAMNVKGVTRVDTSGLHVGGSAMAGTSASASSAGMSAGMGNSHNPVSDTWISTKVMAKLHTIDGLDNSDLHVETNDGVVMLTGSVASDTKKDMAVAAVKSIQGVKSVDTSDLKVGTSSK